MTYKILLIEDEEYQAEALSGFLEKNEFQVDWSSSFKSALELLTNKDYDVIISDYRLKDGTGENILDFLAQEKIKIPIIMITAFGNIDLAVRLMSKGAYSFLEKPINLNNLKEVIIKCVNNYQVIKENEILKKQLQDKAGLGNIIYQSKKMENILSLSKKAALTDVTVLITGESGTGKELIARFIHENSKRSKSPLISVNCSALSLTLLESELFGHVKGAFTGAEKSRMGRFEQANKGTLFLDEIGEISPEIQVKLLRVLQEKKIERVGGNQTISVDIRLIAATNKDLLMQIQEKAFREDLYYRLNVFHIQVPPLRDRLEDVPVLVEHFINEFNFTHGKKIEKISNEGLEKLLNYNFPGNIRELRNIIERAFIICDEEELSEDSILIQSNSEKNVIEGKTLPEKIEALEKIEMISALKRENGNQTKAARNLGISERVLRYKMNKYSLLNN